MRRLEGKHLAMFGQALFNQAEGCAGFCGNNKFGWLVTNNTLMNAYIKRFTAGCFTIKIFAARASQTKRNLMLGRIEYALL
jgi:hypothetical protein